jgi:hypothetical protein
MRSRRHPAGCWTSRTWRDKASPIERHGGHLLVGDHLASLSICSLDMRRRFGDCDRIGPLSNPERCVDHRFPVDVDRHAGATEWLETWGIDPYFVAANRQTLERIESLAIGGNALFNGCGHFSCRHFRARNGRAARVGDGPE